MPMRAETARAGLRVLGVARAHWPREAGLCLLAGFGSTGWFEALKLWRAATKKGLRR